MAIDKIQDWAIRGTQKDGENTGHTIFWGDESDFISQ